MQLDYLKDIGVDAISLSPIFDGTSVDSDLNVVNHTTIDNKFGTEDDIKSLIAAAHKKGNQVNIVKAILTINGSEAWTISSDRSAFYLHQLSPDLPDLNLYSRVVIDELNQILHYWISLGVDGFNIRHSGFMLEDSELNNDVQLNSNKPNPYDNMEHKNSFGLGYNMVLLKLWHHIIEDNQGQNGRSLMTGMDSWDRSIPSYRDQFGVTNFPHLSFCTVMNVDVNCDGSCMKNFVEENLKNVTIGKSPTWMLGSDTISRFSTRLGNYTKRSEVLTMIALLLPGSTVLYYGDELMMPDIGQADESSVSISQPWRTPMKWDNSSSSYGFSNATCSSVSSNDAMQVTEAVANGKSMLNFIKKLNKLRKADAFRLSSAADIRYGPDCSGTFSFVRGFDGVDCYLVIANLGSTESCSDFSSVSGGDKETATVKLVTPSAKSGYEEDTEVDTTNVKVKPNEGVVLSWKCGLYFE
ncbi:solute carrier family 3 (neutral and basic amino acid transporter), member 1 [Octopus vulgaris]|uniref:Solute carrier family 3 (Neutral and basic amino acid transporter), member 1 n=1 Tax=Octopus vulgaris TaxID=6645 RepID=A0AA36FEY0_OCTVU|nr:solute carrier family 3 (neutral and basic amino acid transporter), member 1 [Octopus vulgaris]